MASLMTRPGPEAQHVDGVRGAGVDEPREDVGGQAPAVAQGRRHGAERAQEPVDEPMAAVGVTDDHAPPAARVGPRLAGQFAAEQSKGALQHRRGEVIPERVDEVAFPGPAKRAQPLEVESVHVQRGELLGECIH
jgi:hypothetical protein